ncbi:MAG: cation diffusion facilitator family transporter [Thermoanaerobaculia bacterium]
MHDHVRATRQESRRRLGLVLALTIALLAFEAAAGLFTHSLALLADAAHLFGDAAAIGISFLALTIAGRPATPLRTYGFHRVEILAALANGVLLILLSGLILFEAWERFRRPTHIHPGPMLLAAVLALAVNLASLRLLKSGARHSLNLRAAYLEVLSDALTSVGVLVAAIVILTTGWLAADAVVSAAIGLFLLPRTWLLLRDAADILLESTPAEVDLSHLRRALAEIPGVAEVHDLHVWSLTSGLHAMSAHVVRQEGTEHDDLLRRVREMVLAGFEIHHVTLQVESAGCEDSAHD